jgi:hypothetical protein
MRGSRQKNLGKHVADWSVLIKKNQNYDCKYMGMGIDQSSDRYLDINLDMQQRTI